MRVSLACILVGAVLAGCGSSGGRRAVSLMLDFNPNAAHVGIYAAHARGYDRQAGIALKVIPPPSPADSINLLEAGRVDFSVLDIHDLAIARARGADLVGVMAIVERPLASLIAQPGVLSPRELQGRTVGVPGDPSDTAVLNSIVEGAGGDPHRVRSIDIAGNAIPDLLSGRVAAATAFWNDEGVALARARPGFRVFRVDRYGAPSYPELVLCARRATVEGRRGLVRAVVGVLERGYRFAIDDPGAAAGELERAVPGLDRGLVSADLAALRPALAPPDGRPGELNLAALRAWSVWEAKFGIVSRPPDIDQAFAISR